MMLTRFMLNPARRGTMKLLGSPQAMHAAVMASFLPGDETDGAHGRVLWRVDSDGREHSLYVLSPATPDLTHLVEQAGWPTRSTWDSRPYEPLLGRLQADQVWAFRLRANPTKLARDVGKRVGHVSADQQASWLLDRAPRQGFEVCGGGDGTPSLRVTDRQKRAFRRDQDSVTLVTARYDGLLRITDVDAFRGVLVHGLGRAKGYGCGLMTLARPEP